MNTIGSGGEERTGEEDFGYAREGVNERRAHVQEHLDKLSDLTDDKVVNVWVTNHSSGDSIKHKIAVGELRKRLDAAITNEEYGDGIVVQFEDGGSADFGYHDPISFEEVTPEVLAYEVQEAEDERIISELQKEGVDTRVFYNHDEMGVREIRIRPEEIVALAEKIKPYLTSKEVENS